jgi:hypothetical protein
MNVEIGAEAALFPEKEYISGIFVEGFAITISVKNTYLENVGFEVKASAVP